MLILWRFRPQSNQLQQETQTKAFQDNKCTDVGKRECSVAIGTVRLEPSLVQTNSGPHLSSQPSHCFTIPLRLEPKKKLQAQALLDSGASACFIDEEFAKRHRILLIEKPTPVHVEAIDGRALSSGDVTHETKPLEVSFAGHKSTF